MKHGKTAAVPAAPHHRALAELEFVSNACKNALRGVIEAILAEVLRSIDGFPEDAADFVAKTIVDSLDIEVIAEPFATFLDIPNPTEQDFTNLIEELTDPDLVIGPD